jgi:hypothetical protein
MNTTETRQPAALREAEALALPATQEVGRLVSGRRIHPGESESDGGAFEDSSENSALTGSAGDR